MTQPDPESFLEELKRRKVVRVALVYAAVAWGVAQVADVALSTFEAPLWAMQTTMTLLALGFPLAAVLAWAIRGRREAADADLSRSSALLPPAADHADAFESALFRAYSRAMLGDGDGFFAELTPHAHMPSLLYARQLRDDPILSRFAADPRHDELIRALQSPLH